MRGFQKAWATIRQQSLNKRVNRLLHYNGKTQSMKEWADDSGLCYSTLNSRLRYGWSIERTLEAKIRKINLPNRGFEIERRILKHIGAKRHLRSGAIPGFPNDGVKNAYLLEVKSTVRGEIPVKRKWLEELAENAILRGKTPAMVMVFTDSLAQSMETWVLIPKNDFERLTKNWIRS